MVVKVGDPIYRHVSATCPGGSSLPDAGRCRWAVPSQEMQRVKLPQTEPEGQGCSDAVFHGHGMRSLCKVPPTFMSISAAMTSAASKPLPTAIPGR